MAERAQVYELSQLGIEVTEGVSVAATKRLSASGIDLGVGATFNELMALGYNLPVLEDLTKQWTIIRAQGELTYTEPIYFLSSLLKYQVPAPGGTTSQVWTFDPSSNAAEVIKTYTIEQGQTARAAKASGCRFDGMTIDLDRNAGCKFTATGLGQLYTDGATLTALTSAAEVPLVPALGPQLDFFLDPTSGAFGTTKLLRATKLNLSITGRYTPFFAANSANGSYATLVPAAGKISGSLAMEWDAAGGAQLANMTAGSTFYLRGRATGALIEVGHNYQFTEDLCVKISGAPTASADQGVRAITYPFTVVHDSGYGRGLTIKLENLITAL